jgi:hypothetical protein
MPLKSIQKVKLFQLLFLIDEDLAEQQRAKNCPYCKSSVHTSNYPRKPRGGPDNLPEDLLIRHSFCCSEETCRKRVLPASCRFWDRKVYWGVVILISVTLLQGRTEGNSAGKLMRLLDVSRQTLKRWMVYFRKDFPVTNKWKRVKGFIGVEIPGDLFPRALVLILIEQTGSVEQGLIKSLKLISGGIEMF